MAVIGKLPALALATTLTGDDTVDPFVGLEIVTDWAKAVVAAREHTIATRERKQFRKLWTPGFLLQGPSYGGFYSGYIGGFPDIYVFLLQPRQLQPHPPRSWLHVDVQADSGNTYYSCEKT